MCESIPSVDDCRRQKRWVTIKSPNYAQPQSAHTYYIIRRNFFSYVCVCEYKIKFFRYAQWQTINRLYQIIRLSGFYRISFSLIRVFVCTDFSSFVASLKTFYVILYAIITTIEHQSLPFRLRQTSIVQRFL